MRKKTRKAKTTRTSSSRSVYPSGGRIIKQSGKAHITPVMKYRIGIVDKMKEKISNG